MRWRMEIGLLLSLLLLLSVISRSESLMKGNLYKSAPDGERTTELYPKPSRMPLMVANSRVIRAKGSQSY